MFDTEDLVDAVLTEADQVLSEALGRLHPNFGDPEPGHRDGLDRWMRRISCNEPVRPVVGVS